MAKRPPHPTVGETVTLRRDRMPVRVEQRARVCWPRDRQAPRRGGVSKEDFCEGGASIRAGEEGLKDALH